MDGCVQGMFVLGEGLDMELCKNMKTACGSAGVV